MRAPLFLCSAVLVFSGCGEDSPTPDASASIDGGVKDATSAPPDLGLTVNDGGGTDAGPAPDVGPADLGTAAAALRPGAGLTLPSGQTIAVSTDTFASVESSLGMPGTRTDVRGARSYEWPIGGTVLAVWFANTNLDDDDAAPADVDGTDAVLWVSVSGRFDGRSEAGVGLGSTRAEVEAAYGPAGVEASVDTPPGRRASYYRRGLWVTYDASDVVRTFAVSRSYPAEPSGPFEVREARVRLTSGDVQGTRGLGRSGTSQRNVMTALGPPDGQGTVRLGGTELRTWSYGYFGLELFFLSSSDNVLFIALHAPYVGQEGGVGVGSPRMAVEAMLDAAGYRNPTPSSTPQLICYGEGANRVGVTYDQSGVATTFSFRLLTCP